MTHEERLKRQSPVGLLQLQGKAGDCVLAAHLIDLSPVVTSEFFQANQRLGPQGAVKMVKVCRRAEVGGKHTMDSLDWFVRWGAATCAGTSWLSLLPTAPSLPPSSFGREEYYHCHHPTTPEARYFVDDLIQPAISHQIEEISAGPLAHPPPLKGCANPSHL